MPIPQIESSGIDNTVKMSLRCYLSVVLRIASLYLDNPILVNIELVNLLLLPGLPDGLGQLSPLLRQLEVQEEIHVFVKLTIT